MGQWTKQKDGTLDKSVRGSGAPLWEVVMRYERFLMVVGLVLMMSCGSSGGTDAPPDAPTDTGVDTSPDAGVDTGLPPNPDDSDGDGLSDAAEAVVGTDPNNSDCDDDGIKDGAEFVLGTNPLGSDSDGDTLLDGDEVAAGTDPARADSDGDGFADNVEAAAMTDPLDRFQWPFGGAEWPNMRPYGESVYGTGWDYTHILSDFEAVDQFNNPVDLWQFYGTVILLDFSAGWCMPCREAAAEAEVMWEKYRDQGFIIIHILTEGVLNGTPATIELQQEWAEKYGISFPVLRQDADPIYKKMVESSMYTGSLPFLVLLDREMRLDSAYGYKKEVQIEFRLETLLAVDPPTLPAASEWPGEPDDATAVCDSDADGFLHISCGGADCDDNDDAIHPDADELCDGVDHNCDGRIHVGATDTMTHYADLDQDGYGSAVETLQTCVPRWPYVENMDDCDDTDEKLNPDTPWYEDSDKDGYGNPLVVLNVCEQPEGYVRNAQDIDDTDDQALGCWQYVTAGRDHTCGLRLNGTVACWGSNEKGNLDTPPGTFTAVSAGYNHTCALDAAGEVTCWGNPSKGATVPPPGPFTSVSCGINNCCGLKGTTGTNVTCWGDDKDGKSNPYPATYTAVNAHGWRHACGITDSGSIHCWGQEEYKGAAPTVPPSGTFESLSTGHHFSMGLKADGTPVGWGFNGYGQITPPAGAKFQQVSMGTVHSCGIKLNGELDCWGSDSFKRLDHPPGQFIQVQASQLHSCAVNVDGLLACWGTEEFDKMVPAACTN